MTFHILETKPLLVRYETLRNVERCPQPEGDAQYNPTRNGDCFLCSSYAIIRYFCQQRNVTPPAMEEVYRKVWCHEDIKADTGSTHWSTKKFWEYLNWALDWYDLEFDLVIDPPLHIPDQWEITTFGPKLFSHEKFKQRIQTYLEAGYLVHMEIQAKPTSEYIKEGSRSCGGDHLVVIDGFRITEEQKLACHGEGKPHWYGTIKHWVRVVDSSRKKPEPYWIETDTLLEEHGGYNMYFIRPRVEERFGFPAAPEKCSEH